MKKIVKLVALQFFALIILFSLTACNKSATITPNERINQIIEACENADNEFPSDYLEVEFREFKVPDAEENCFLHEVRFANISGNPIEMQILGFYNLALDEYIVARGGSLQPNENRPRVVIDKGTGWVFANTLTPLYDWESYSLEEQDLIVELASRLYFEIHIEDKVYYCMLDFKNEKVIV